MKRLSLCLLLLTLCVSKAALAQSTDATISGAVVDPTNKVIPDAEILIVNEATGIPYTNKTNGSGIYTISILPPGQYRVQVSKIGFKTLIKPGITLNVQSAVALNFTLPVGATSESITVEAGSSMINTSNGSVSTVIDRKFVENMPLNGRSFQSLILLAPGVETNTPQHGASTGYSGEFSINGQRADANYSTIDGVSANNAVNVGSTSSSASSAGGLAAASALGSTQALISIDALQEFRITTSTNSAEYGRQPGGQIQYETRSGTNRFHGIAFDYIRNSVFDANNWFNDDATPTIPKPAERQNDFGGVLGGPLGIPRLYSGKNRSFFFLSYEGLRLSQPEPATISYVPNGDLRQEAPLSLQPVLNAFPLPNCTAAQNPQCIDDSVEGLSPYLATTSLPSRIDAVSARVDYTAAAWLHLFFRFGNTKSSAVQSITTYTASTAFNTRSYTFGADASIRTNLSNQFRLNYSPTYALSIDQLTDMGGGAPIDLQGLQGLPNGIGQTIIALFLTNETAGVIQQHYGIPQHQWNVVDTVNWQRGRHALRAGADFRRTVSYLNAGSFTDSPAVSYYYYSPTSVLGNVPDFAGSNITARQDPAFDNFSAFIQDEWKIQPRISLSLGLRWELNPPPTIVSGAHNYTLNGSLNDPGSVTLAPLGTPLYSATYHNFAPRLGIAATLHDQPGHETVLRAGGGVYYDLGQQFAGLFGAGFNPGTGVQGYYGAGYALPATFPLPLSQINLPISDDVAPPYGQMNVVSRHLQLPYTYQWNLTLEQALGTDQTVTVGYVGSNSRRLIEQQYTNLAGANPAFTLVESYQNGLSSSYNSLQLQYKRKLSHGLQALASYTWSHGLDSSSQDSNLYPYQRGNSDFDLRNNLTGALSYELPNDYAERWERAIAAKWGVDLRATVRTGFPVEINGPELTDTSTGQLYYSLLNYNRAIPLYLSRPNVPGGRVINIDAFSVPLNGQQGDSPRNFARGFGENEFNLAVRREFPLHEQFHLLFRAEAFNVLNHPNFGAINVACGNPTAGHTCTTPTFGQAISTLASSLGGLTPIYQQGGPRSLQFAFKLQF